MSKVFMKKVKELINQAKKIQDSSVGKTVYLLTSTYLCRTGWSGASGLLAKISSGEKISV